MYRKKRESTYFTLTGMLSYNPNLFDSFSLPQSLDKDTCITEILMTCGLLEIAYPDGDILKDIIKVWSFARSPDWQRMLDALHGTYNPIHNYDRTEDSTVEGQTIGQRGKEESNQYTESEHTDDINIRTDNLKDIRTPNISNTRTDNLSEAHNGGETTTHENTAFNAGLSATSRDILIKNGDSTINTGTQTNVETGTEEINHTGTQKNDRDIDRSQNGTNAKIETENEKGSHNNITHLYARGNIGVTSTQQLIEQEIEIRYKFNIYEIIAREFKEKFCNLTYIL